ncbi:Tetratricopeptide repeat-containing protein, partial [Klenkia terrae]
VTVDRLRLEQGRDQALRDLLDLERQVRDGELPADVADGLRQTYERTAARALALLAAPTPDEVGATSVTDRSSRRGRLVAYGLAVAVALFAAVVLLPVYLGERPTGGTVSGNEALGPVASGADEDTAPRDLSTVTNEEMEDVVAQKPDVLDMRLALAHRYLDEGDYLAAARHYLVALDREPRNVEAQSHYGWLLMQAGEPDQALEYVDRALAQDPRAVEALWFRANIALYGLSDPAGALTVLEQLQQRTDIEPATRSQVETLIAEARAQAGSG